MTGLKILLVAQLSTSTFQWLKTIYEHAVIVCSDGQFLLFFNDQIPVSRLMLWYTRVNGSLSSDYVHVKYHRIQWEGRKIFHEGY